MSSGVLLSRAWDTFWNNKFLILLGVLVVLGMGPIFALQQMLSQWPLSLTCVLIIVAIALWVVGTIARGALIAGVAQTETAGASSFGQAWNAGWRKGWRLVGIGLIPAVPRFVLGWMIFTVIFLLIFLTGVAAMGGYYDYDPLDTFGAGMSIVVGAIICLLAIVPLVLGLLRLMANRAYVLEDIDVFKSYRRGWEVLRENLRQGIILILIQIVIQIVLNLLLFVLPFVPVLVSSWSWPLWPVLWTVLWPIGSAFSAYFSTVWTLAWREWTSKGAFVEQTFSNN